MYIKRTTFIIIFFLQATMGLFSQESTIDSIESKLKNLAKTEDALNAPISITVDNLEIGNFLRAVANNAKVNLNISPDLNFTVTNNFSGVKVMDMLIFICKQYNLDIDVIGNIISIKKKEIPPEPKPKIVKKEILIEYDKTNELLSFDLKNDTLSEVVKKIIQLSGKNIVLSPNIQKAIVSGYVQKESIDKAISMMAFANNLAFEKDKEKEFYILKSQEEKVSNNTQRTSRTTTRNSRNTRTSNTDKNKESGDIQFELFENNLFNIYTEKSNVEDIVRFVCDSLHINYFITTELTADISLNLEQSNFDVFLQHIFSGLKYSYIKKDEVYLFGETQIQELRTIKTVQLQYRSVEKVEEIIPSDLKKELEIKEFLDLNSLLVSGEISKVNLVEDFLKDIDRLVPVVLIEVMVVDISKSATIEAGMQFGTSNDPVISGGSVFPGVDYTLNSNSINKIINSFNGFGTLNLGKVNPNFYLSLKALESNGSIKIRSTPKLATLNGNEANLTIGKTTYYKEQTQNLSVNQSTTNVTTTKFTPVNADLTIKIKPVVSGDEQITLEVEVKQSDFGARSSLDAPPDQVSREFKSIIRVKNQEMILLGGLEEKTNSNSGTGTPFLSKIPVIKWLFSSRVKENKNAKLNIFIKPTVIN